MSDVTIMENVTENEVAKAIGDAVLNGTNTIITEEQPSMDLADVPMTDPVQDLKDISYQSGYTDGYGDAAGKYQGIVKSTKTSSTVTGMLVGGGITVATILGIMFYRKHKAAKIVIQEAADNVENFEEFKDCEVE